MSLTPGDARRGPPRTPGPEGSPAPGEEPAGELRMVARDTGWAATKALLQKLDGRVRQAPEHRVRRGRTGTTGWPTR
ncbi:MULTISPECIES: hypothetical protein [Streptomyces]|uniref:Uncharacterized protein n=1 Tax=Streptomyces fimbriatus TaxID=68197 RepID=A0ABW0DGT1_STRFI